MSLPWVVKVKWSNATRIVIVNKPNEYIFLICEIRDSKEIENMHDLYGFERNGGGVSGLWHVDNIFGFYLPEGK